MQRIAADPSQTNRLRGVVLGNGPHVLMASSDQPRPTLVLAAGRDGRLRLAKHGGLKFHAIAVSGVDASEKQILEAARAARPVILAPWGGIDRARAAAFVFDVILVPADSAAGKAIENLPAN
jgi:hypothetical protein